MKSDLILYVAGCLDSDRRFKHLGRGANNGVWETEEIIYFRKNMAKKGYGFTRVSVFDASKDGLSLKIEIHVPTYGDWETFFEGFIESTTDFDRVLVMTGLE